MVTPTLQCTSVTTGLTTVIKGDALVRSLMDSHSLTFGEGADTAPRVQGKSLSGMEPFQSRLDSLLLGFHAQT